MRVLVVDDDDDLRDTLAFVLQEEGYAVEVAVDGADAWERVDASDKPGGVALDLLIVDLMMPRRNGESLLRQIRGNVFRSDTVFRNLVLQVNKA